jgi:hypothetical protein
MATGRLGWIRALSHLSAVSACMPVSRYTSPDFVVTLETKFVTEYAYDTNGNPLGRASTFMSWALEVSPPAH